MTYLNDIDLPDPPWIGNPDYWMEMLNCMDDIYAINHPTHECEGLQKP